jgi:hypothetical protein
MQSARPSQTLSQLRRLQNLCAMPAYSALMSLKISAHLSYAFNLSKM